jgi:hypothetical protein
LLAAALAAMAVVIMAACATTVQQEIANEPPTSVDALAYFPFQVKGYQNSYARRRILVLTPADARRWIIHDGHDGKILYASETMAGAPVGPEETGASLALSSDLATLSKEIASRVIELKQHRRAKTVATSPASSPDREGHRVAAARREILPNARRTLQWSILR